MSGLKRIEKVRLDCIRSEQKYRVGSIGLYQTEKRRGEQEERRGQFVIVEISVRLTIYKEANRSNIFGGKKYREGEGGV